MTSTNSLSNNRFLPMFKNVFKRNIALFLVVQILSSLYAFFIPRLSLKSIAEMAAYIQSGYQSNLTSTLVLSMSFFLYAAGSLWAFILAVSLFKEIYSKRASIFYFAMPVKRETYFNVNMLYGIITVLTSYVLIAALSIIAVKTNNICPPELYTFEPVTVMKVLTVAMLSVLVAYAIVMLFAVLSGRKWHYIVLSFLATNLIYTSVINVIRFINASVWGLSIPYDKLWVLSPVAPFVECLSSENILKFVIVLIIQFALIYVTGYSVFKKRKAEIAEASIAGRIIPATVFVLALLTIGSYCLAMSSGSIYAALAVVLAVTAVASIIITAIFKRKAFTKLSLKCLIGTLAALLVIVAAVEFLPNIKYKTYVPAASEVESVEYDESYWVSDSDGIVSSLFDTLFYTADYFNTSYDGLSPYNFTSEEAKAKVEELHKKLVEQSTIENQYSDDYYYHGSYSVKITYTLKNGKTVERFYDVCAKDIYNEYIALMQTEEALKQTPPFSYKEEDIQFISIMDHNSEVSVPFEDDYVDWDFDASDSTVYERLDDYAPLFDSAIKDKANESKDVFYSLMQSDSFYVYDIDNHYRDRENEGFDFETLLDGDYIDTDWTYENEDDYPDYRDVTITVYTYNSNVTEEMKKKFSEMTPEEIKDFEMEYMLREQGYLLNEGMIYLNNEEDAGTISYLKSIGLLQQQ